MEGKSPLVDPAPSPSPTYATPPRSTSSKACPGAPIKQDPKYKRIGNFVPNEANDGVILCRVSVRDSEDSELLDDDQDDEGDEKNCSSNNEWIEFFHNWIREYNVRGRLILGFSGNAATITLYGQTRVLNVSFIPTKETDTSQAALLASLVTLVQKHIPPFFC